MGDQSLRIDKAKLDAFAAQCISVADKLRNARAVHGGRYLGQTSNTGTEPSLDPAKQLLGTAEYPHSGRTAGRLLAEHISKGEAKMVRVEDALRMMADAITKARGEFETEDFAEKLSGIFEELQEFGRIQ